MRPLIAASLALLAPCGWGQSLTYHPAPWGPIDLRASAWANFAIDGVQTSQFPFRGITEQNPFVSPFVTRRKVSDGTFAAASILTGLALDSWIDKQPAKDRTALYGVWWAVHAATIVNNNGLGLKGLPVVIPVFKGTFKS